jgi:hypothetical protein
MRLRRSVCLERTAWAHIVPDKTGSIPRRQEPIASCGEAEGLRVDKHPNSAGTQTAHRS